MQPTALILYTTPLFRDLVAALLSTWGMRTTCLSIDDGMESGTVPAVRTAFLEIGSDDLRLSDRMDTLDRIVKSIRNARTEASQVYGLDVIRDSIVEFPRRTARSLPALEAAVRATAEEN